MAGLELDCPDSPNDTGAFRIAWEGPVGAEYRLTEDNGEASRIVYQGTDLASTMTGRTTEVYRYRLEVVAPEGLGLPAEQCAVAVAPPPLGLALSLFGVGLVICLATTGLIVRGHRRHRRGELG